MRRIQIRLGLAFLIGVGSGCIAPQSDAITRLIASSPNATIVATPSATGDAYLTVSTAWESAPDQFQSFGTCALQTGAALRTSTCILRIPEGQLHYSKVKFTYGTSNPGLCARVVFYPASFIASKTDVAFINTWSTAIPAPVDCTVLDGFGRPTNHGCYWGAAPRIMTDYPVTGGHYVLTAKSLEAFDTVNSENEDRTSLRVAPSNLGICNKNDAPGVGMVAGGQNFYVANSLTPYQVQCLDIFEQTLGTVNVFIADQDLSTGESPGVPANDQYYDWGESL